MSRWRTWGVAVALAALVVLALPAVGMAAGIILDRVPSPPQAIQQGQSESIGWTVTYTSVAKQTTLSVLDPSSQVVSSTPTTYNYLLPGEGSPLSASNPFATLPGSTPGRYTVALEFTSSIGLESTATTVFDVARSLGAMTLTKYEDMNGNGVRDPGEPGVPNWPFNLVNEMGGTSTVGTGADGTVTFTNVPSGHWQVGELPAPAGWAFINPKGGVGSFDVPPGGVGTFIAGNARPAPLSGIVWIDTNRNGVLDVGEGAGVGVLVTLTGVTGTGDQVGGSTATASNGGYVFPGLLPGTYSVTVTVPAGFTATTPTTLGGIPMVSNTPSPNHNFGIVPTAPAPAASAARPAGATTTAAKPGLTITKTGPGTAKPGETYAYTIKVSNPGKANARNVVVTDPIPDRMTYVSSSPKGTLENGVLTWKLGTLKPKAVKTLTFRVRLDPTAPAGKYTNTATARATGIGPKKASTTLTVAAPPRAPRTGGVTG
jgi:uncharacterized repeat protein (TIGR01451 family)